jgi:DNA-binding response OmpR family regulator
MVYGTVQRHRGTIDIQSALGQGTTVIVTLPVQVAAEQKPSQTTPCSQGQNLRVLLVEDEPVIQEILVAYLVEDGHFVETADDGERGLEKFKAGHFDLVITDQVMERMNGLEMAEAIRKLSPGLPVLLVTGHGETIERVAGQTLPVDSILGKPVSAAALRKTIAAVLAAKQTQNEPGT